MEDEVVWEYAPDWVSGGGFFGSVYRAYRVRYSFSFPKETKLYVNKKGNKILRI